MTVIRSDEQMKGIGNNTGEGGREISGLRG